MNFRKEMDLLPKIIESDNIYYLQTEVWNFGQDKDIIDLQYSTHFDLNDKKNVYSVFLLYREQVLKENIEKETQND